MKVTNSQSVPLDEEISKNDDIQGSEENHSHEQ
jgi:hypothetical protein